MVVQTSGNAYTYRKTLTRTDFAKLGGATNVVLSQGEYIELANFKIPAGQIVSWGNGAITGGVDDRGTLTLKLKSSTANITGTARFIVTDPNRVVTNVRREDRTEALNSGIKFAYDSAGSIQQDSLLIIQFKADKASQTVNNDDNDTELTIPITLTSVVQ